jgi:hypothetical protein
MCRESGKDSPTPRVRNAMLGALDRLVGRVITAVQVRKDSPAGHKGLPHSQGEELVALNRKEDSCFRRCPLSMQRCL